jgi:hypothetical protein
MCVYVVLLIISGFPNEGIEVLDRNAKENHFVD